MTKLLQLKLGRSAKTSLAEQIRNGISTAIENGVRICAQLIVAPRADRNPLLSSLR